MSMPTQKKKKTDARIQVEGESLAQLMRLVEATGLSLAEATESAISQATAAPLSLLPKAARELSPATHLEMRDSLSPITSSRVAGIRLGALNKDGAQESPWPRNHCGLSIDGSSDLSEVWSSTRGWWVIAPETSFLVAYRTGAPLYVFRVTDWSTPAPSERRRWAESGYALVQGRRVCPVTGADEGPATATETAVAEILQSHRLQMKPQSVNPVVVLRD